MKMNRKCLIWTCVRTRWTKRLSGCPRFLSAGSFFIITQPTETSGDKMRNRPTFIWPFPSEYPHHSLHQEVLEYYWTFPKGLPILFRPYLENIQEPWSTFSSLPRYILWLSIHQQSSVFVFINIKNQRRYRKFLKLSAVLFLIIFCPTHVHCTVSPTQSGAIVLEAGNYVKTLNSFRAGQD